MQAIPQANHRLSIRPVFYQAMYPFLQQSILQLARKPYIHPTSHTLCHSSSIHYTIHPPPIVHPSIICPAIHLIWYPDTLLPVHPSIILSIPFISSSNQTAIHQAIHSTFEQSVLTFSRLSIHQAIKLSSHTSPVHLSNQPAFSRSQP